MFVPTGLSSDSTQGAPELLPSLGAGVPQPIPPFLQPPDSNLPLASRLPRQLLDQVEVPAHMHSCLAATCNDLT